MHLSSGWIFSLIILYHIRKELFCDFSTQCSDHIQLGLLMDLYFEKKKHTKKTPLCRCQKILTINVLSNINIFLSFHGFLKGGILSLIFGFQSDVLTLKMRYLYLLLVNFSDERGGGGVFPTPKIPPLWIRNCLPKGIDNLKKSLK